MALVAPALTDRSPKRERNSFKHINSNEHRYRGSVGRMTTQNVVVYPTEKNVIFNERVVHYF